MNVFICWSGTRSERVAKALYEWLGDTVQALRPFMSSESIRKGDRWRGEIAETLATTNYGILCLTAENLASPWILFEAGALSKHLKDSRVTALLVGIEPAQIVEPLSQFQATPAARDPIFRLVKELNELLPPEQRLTPPERLQRALESHWPRLEKAIENALAEKIEQVSKPSKRSSEDMIQEILTLVRELKRSGAAFVPEAVRVERHHIRPVTTYRAQRVQELRMQEAAPERSSKSTEPTDTPEVSND